MYYRSAMVCVLARLLFALILTETSASPSASETEQASPCSPRWLLFGQRCFAFYPVWSSWTNADLMCSQKGGHLASLHTPEERQFVRQLANTHLPVWLGGRQAQQIVTTAAGSSLYGVRTVIQPNRMNGSCFWSDDSPFRISGWTNQRQGKAGEGGTCMAIKPKSGELGSAPCGDLRFYVCSTRASSNKSSADGEPVEPGIVAGGSLFDVVWSYSDPLAEEILHSSSVLRGLRSGRLTQSCYDSFIQQEALYLHRVSSTLQVLMSGLLEADDVTSLLLDTLKQYSSSNQSLLASPPPQWLQSSLQSFHSVVLEEPVYWLVALSARACLRDFLSRELLSSSSSSSEELRGSGSELKASLLLREWREDTRTEVTWIRRYRTLIEERQPHMDVFQAVDIFREHMMNQKSLYKAANCDEEDKAR
ncbi:uncharacterized protein LOC116385325 isoform X2 [Anarrhichthys ocellatus]|uniref:uncharacterized protein LOC116385325 isoform X2 n=1 Tax=Anarrhichthys ocellatus TaxID=433405 RepID=UPI0012EEAED0|nr:uncharacterized protein LOC116385325 isoform X2 [Anarrhichthys ocellatus]